jgi:GxxExxY protein
MDNLLHSDVTGEILKAFYKVYNDLGYGFLEKVYENSMAFELQANGLFVQQQLPINVFYSGKIAGEYFADLIVESKVIIEIKTASSIDKAHEAQLLNYLKATEIEVGLVLNFGPKPEKVRKVFTNKKRSLVESLFDEN